MPNIFGTNYWLFQSSLSDGLGYYLYFTSFDFSSPGPILFSLSWIVFVCCLNPLFIPHNAAAVFLLHYLISSSVLPLKWLLLGVLLFNDLPFLAYHILNWLDPQREGRPVFGQLRSLQYLSIASVQIKAIHYLILNQDDPEENGQIMTFFSFALMSVGLSCFLAHLENQILLLRHRRVHAA